MQTKNPIGTSIKPTQASMVFEKMDMVFANLMSRWLDESEYEDINDYLEVIKNAAKQLGIVGEFSKMSKKPFGCEFHAEGKKYKFTMTSTGRWSYKQIG